jgi:hypothetical protein
MDYVLAVEFGIPVITELYSRFFVKPNVTVNVPTLEFHDLLFEINNHTTTRRIYNIAVFASNKNGRTPASDATVFCSVRPGREHPSFSSACGWLTMEGSRKLRLFLTDTKLPLLANDEEGTLFHMADVFDERLLEARASIPRGLGRNAIIGYGIEGINRVFLAGDCYPLPIKDLALQLRVSNDDYGELVTRHFAVNCEEWAKPRFTPVD